MPDRRCSTVAAGWRGTGRAIFASGVTETGYRSASKEVGARGDQSACWPRNPPARAFRGASRVVFRGSFDGEQRGAIAPVVDPVLGPTGAQDSAPTQAPCAGVVTAWRTQGSSTGTFDEPCSVDPISSVPTSSARRKYGLRSATSARLPTDSSRPLSSTIMRSQMLSVERR